MSTALRMASTPTTSIAETTVDEVRALNVLTRTARPVTAHPEHLFHEDPVALAPLLLGAELTHRTADGEVRVRLTEIEAYRGHHTDPGSHAFRGPTPRTQVMFKEPAHLFVYLTYGMHTMLNLVAHPEGVAGGILLRAAELLEGHDLVAERRRPAPERDWLRGPGRLAQALGIRLSDNGTSLFESPDFGFTLDSGALSYRRTPRTGVSGPGGAASYDWRFVVVDDAGREHPSTLPYKRHPKSH
ncbi:MAG: DNA-3-methyladenine glycosylase [Microbacteriaceae bacterium]